MRWDDDELYHLQWGHQAMDVPRASVLVAEDNGRGMIGVAPKAELWS